MNAICAVLGLPHFPKGVGSSVHNDFIDAVARAVLGEGVAGAFKDKYRKIEAVITALGGRYEKANPSEPGHGDTSEGTASGGGGTVTNRGLGKILDLLLVNGVPPSTIWHVPVEVDLETQLAASESFDPTRITTEREHRLAEITSRPGASEFRNSVRRAYSYRCCITDADVLKGLEVAHIEPYRGPDTDRVDNALLLRADVHRLFDGGLLGIDAETYSVVLSPVLLGTAYASLAGKEIRRPDQSSNWPSSAALKLHRERHKL